MRKLPLLLVLLLLSMLVTASSAQASLLSPVDRALPFLALDEEDEITEQEAEEAEHEEFCPAEEAREEPCEEDEAEEERDPAGRSKAKDEAAGDECLLKNASAAVSNNPGKRRLRLTVRYRTLKPATVSVEASLQGPKGAVRLGTEHARFRLSGTYRDTYELTEKQAKKALAAREFSVELHVVNAPPSCGVELTAASHRAKS
jgi:hypothetical protein